MRNTWLAEFRSMYRRRTVTNKCEPVLAYVMPFRKEGQFVDIRVNGSKLGWGLQGLCSGKATNRCEGDS